MKLLYLFTSPNLKGSSVQSKVLNQIKYLNKLGVQCHGAFFSTEVNELTTFNGSVNLIPVQHNNWKYFKASGRKRNLMKAVIDYCEKQSESYDFILFRYPGTGFLLKKYSKKFGYKTIFEHLSYEFGDILLQAEDHPIKFNISSLLSRIEYVTLPILREKLFAYQIRRNTKMGFCNSKDVADWQKKIANGKYKTFVNGDAVETEHFPISSHPIFTNELNLIFLKGAATTAIYNGLDRVLQGIKLYEGNCKILLHLLGSNLEYEKNLAKQIGINTNQLICYDYCSGAELNKLFDKMHIGIGPFGIHRKGFKSISAIKTREYFARGIPFIIGHHDPDFSENDSASNFFQEFPADDSPVNFNRVVDWYKILIQNNNFQVSMRTFANDFLDYNIKMRKIVECLNQTT